MQRQEICVIALADCTIFAKPRNSVVASGTDIIREPSSYRISCAKGKLRITGISTTQIILYLSWYFVSFVNLYPYKLKTLHQTRRMAGILKVGFGKRYTIFFFFIHEVHFSLHAAICLTLQSVQIITLVGTFRIHYNDCQLLFCLVSVPPLFEGEGGRQYLQ